MGLNIDIPELKTSEEKNVKYVEYLKSKCTLIDATFWVIGAQSCVSGVEVDRTHR